MKKVLALVVALALVFTTLAGCIVTSAATTEIELSADSVEVAAATAADITVNGVLAAEADFVTVLSIYVDTAFAFNGIYDVIADKALVAYDAEAEAAAEDAGEDYDFDYVVDTHTDGRILVKSLKAHSNEFSYAINVTAPANDSCDAVTYAKAIEVVADYAAFDDDAVSSARADAEVVVSGKGHTPAAVEKDADNHWTVCACGEATAPEAHTWNEGEVTTEPTVDAEGVKTYTCTFEGCGATKTEAIDKLEPTGPVEDDTLVVAGASVSYGVSSLQLGFRVRKTVIQKYASMQLVIMPQKYDTSTFNLLPVEEIIVPLAVGGTFTTYNYTDIFLYELGLNIDYMLRGYDANGELVAVSPVYTTSPAAFLKTAYETSDAKMRTLITDTLIVGDAAAKTFAVEGSDLANAPSILEGFDTSDATTSYGDLNSIDEHIATDAAYGTASSCAHQVRKSVAIGKVPYITYRIKGASGLDINKFAFTVSYTQITGSGGATTNYNKTFTAADGSVYKSGSFAMFKFDQVGLLDSNANLSIVATYDGAEIFNATYSIETFLGANIESASGELVVALIKLGISAREYFA